MVALYTDNVIAVTVKNMKGEIRIHALCLLFALASFLFGYDIGILATIYVNKGWIVTLHHPSAPQKGLITAIYYLGTWISFVFVAAYLADRLGRRWAAWIGALVICIGSAIQAGSNGKGAYAMMIVGRIVAGFGTSIVATTVPLYQSETAPSKRRGRFVVMNHIGFVTGLAVAFWCGYAFSFWKHGKGFDLAWRLSIAVQYIPALIFMGIVPFVPESPRWLLSKGRFDQARKSLAWIRGVEHNPEAIDPELTAIRSNIEYHQTHDIQSWTTLFTNKDLFARLWRAAFLQFIAQMSGATAIKYYLPTNFTALGLNTTTALLAGGIESTLKIGCTIFAMLMIDRLGRRTNLLIGAFIMSIALLINGALPQAYPHNKNRASDYACIVFIFFYTFGNGIGYGPTSWVYGAEIFPTHVRAKGLCISASGGSIGSIIVAQIWPVGIANIGSKTYFIFMAFNLVSIILIYMFYPETKGKSLEEMDNLFGKHGYNGPTMEEQKIDDNSPPIEQQYMPTTEKV